MARITDMRGDVEGQKSRPTVMSSFSLMHVCPITRQRKAEETPTLAGKLSMPRLTFHTSSKVKRSKVKGQGHQVA